MILVRGKPMVLNKTYASTLMLIIAETAHSTKFQRHFITLRHILAASFRQNLAVLIHAGWRTIDWKKPAIYWQTRLCLYARSPRRWELATQDILYDSFLIDLVYLRKNTAGMANRARVPALRASRVMRGFFTGCRRRNLPFENELHAFYK